MEDLAPTGIRSPDFPDIASHYTDYAILAPSWISTGCYCNFVNSKRLLWQFGEFKPSVLAVW